MRLSFGLQQQQVQKQIMAPRMIQSMEILQLPLMALQERIEQEMNENPVLELSQAETAESEEQTEKESPDAPEETERELVVDEKSDNVDDFERLVDLDREVPEYFDDRPRASAKVTTMSITSRPSTPAEHATLRSTSRTCPNGPPASPAL